MAKGRTKTRGPASPAKEPPLVLADGLDHPISMKLCKRLNRFFEAVTLLSSLVDACSQNSHAKAPNDTSEPSGSLHKPLEFYINKLAQVCDNRPGGDTITSAAIVQPPDKVMYAFASNQRSATDIKKVHEFVFKLLYYVSKVDAKALAIEDDEPSPPFLYILRNILEFNRARIELYQKGLLRRLSDCIPDCERDESEQSSVLKKQLQWLQKVTGSSQDSTERDDSQCTSTEFATLVRAAATLRHSTAYRFIEDKTKVGRIDESQRWCELQHFIGRLFSYFQAVQAIAGARKRYPELFDTETIEIHFVDSSKPLPNPMVAFQSGLPPIQRKRTRTANEILSRMTSDKEKIQTYRGYAEDLQRCELDTRIAGRCEKEFRPIVHSEVLLLEWLRKEFAEETHSVPFYGGVKYIGCSKPTCRLCSYYFAAHSSGVRVRQPHPNVYPSWTIPYVLEEDKETLMFKNKMIDAVLDKVREDAFTALRDKVSERKRFDSNTYSSQPTYQSLVSGSVNLEDLVSQISGLSIVAPPRDLHRAVRGPAIAGDDSWSVVVEESETEDEDDGGGTLVFSGRGSL